MSPLEMRYIRLRECDIFAAANEDRVVEGVPRREQSERWGFSSRAPTPTVLRIIFVLTVSSGGRKEILLIRSARIRAEFHPACRISPRRRFHTAKPYFTAAQPPCPCPTVHRITFVLTVRFFRGAAPRHPCIPPDPPHPSKSPVFNRGCRASPRSMINGGLRGFGG